jgi:DNA replication protein DnaC
MESQREIIQRKAEALKARANSGALTSSESVKSPVSRSTYLERLKEQVERDKKLVEETQRAKIAQYEEEWRNKIDIRWQDASLEQIHNEDHKRIINDRIDRHESRDGMNRTSLVISGMYGRGKTYLAYAYPYELIHRGIMLPSQIFFSTETALANISHAGFKKHEEFQKLLHPHYKFFLIDDVGRGSFKNEFERGEMWFSLIDHIYTRRLTLVLTTNLVSRRDAPNSLAAWLGEAAVERLRHMTGSDGNIILDGQDFRKKKGDEWESTYQQQRSQ